MKQNDKLWETEQEDLELMIKLYEQIVSEAKSKGFKGIVEIYMGTGEACIDLYETEEDYELGRVGTIEPAGSFGFCRPLIECIEEILSR